MQRSSRSLLAGPFAGPLNYLGAIAIATAIWLSSPNVSFADSGMATWYGPGFQGNRMYNGQIYNMYDPTTTACNIYPLGTWIAVTNPANGRMVTVQVRDRGAFQHALDLSYAAFKLIADPALMQVSVIYQVVSGPGAAPTPQRAVAASSSAPAASATHYTVQAGDTLSGIATKFSIDPGALATWNGVSDPNLLAPGQTLRLTAPPAPAPAAVAPASPTGKTYVVQPGDDLLSIAQNFGVPANAIAAANAISDPNAVAIGQSIVIPSGSPAPSHQSYVVQTGDTLSSIARAYQVSVASLLAANQVDNPDALDPGVTLTIPAN